MTGEGFQLDRGTPGTIRLSGVLSFDTAASALKAIEASLAAEPAACLDLAGVSRSDSAGLACVLALQAQVSQRGQSLTVSNVPEGMRVLAQVCEVEHLVVG